MIEVEAQPERVLLVGVQIERYTDVKFEMILDELHALTETAGGIPVKTITQKLRRLDSKSGVGSGKLEEINDIVDQEDIDLVIFLNSLSPSSARYIESVLQVRVIDRVQLILDIFAMRARSKEGKLQVELAQYDYLLPRIQGQGKYLSRQGAGIGTRGPGETKLESDRRHIRFLMGQIKKELAQLASHRERTRTKRQKGKEFNIGLMGYTNAGKSTLLRELTLSDTYVQDQLFATLDPLTRKLELNGQECFTLTDTVGFIEELPTELIHAFKSTLEEMRYMDLLVHVVDASHPSHELHEKTVLQLIEELELHHIPIVTVYNKADKVGTDFVPTLFPNVVISALNKDDQLRVKHVMWQALLDEMIDYKVVIQPHDAWQLAQLKQETFVTDMDFDETHQHYVVQGYKRQEEK